jgi:DNA-binding LacI/PurR family transcriptional regulator
MPTIKDVAKACGVSATTVSGILNNTPNAAGPKTRARVLDTIRRMNYSPSAVARGLSHRRMDMIGVVLDPGGWASLMADQHLGPIVDGVVSQSSHMRQRTVLYTERWSDWQNCLSVLSDGLCDGLLLIVPLVPDEFFEQLSRRKVPFVIIGDHRPEPDLSICDVDNVDAGRQITRHLIDLGHARIAMLRGEQSHQSSGLRATGYREALNERGVEYLPGLDMSGGYTRESGYEQTLALLDLPRDSRPTAIFGGDDRIAVGALEALKERGVRVPEDISVAGVNDSIEGATGHPPLTSLRQPSSEIGQEAVNLLLAHVRGVKDPGRKAVFPGTLIVRGTTGRAA